MRHTPRRLLATLLLGPGLLAALTIGSAGTAQAAPTCEYPAAACEGPTLALSTSVAKQGEVVDAAGAKFVANRDVTLVLRPNGSAAAAAAFTPDHGVGAGRVTLVSATKYTLAAKRSYTLKTVRTGSDGSFATRVTAPKTAFGKYTVVAINGTPAGFSDPTAPLRITRGSTVLDENNNPSNNNETTTAFTGFNMLWLLLLAAALIALGVYVTRRGKKTEVVRSIHG